MPPTLPPTLPCSLSLGSQPSYCPHILGHNRTTWASLLQAKAHTRLSYSGFSEGPGSGFTWYSRQSSGPLGTELDSPRAFWGPSGTQPGSPPGPTVKHRIPGVLDGSAAAPAARLRRVSPSGKSVSLFFLKALISF